MYKKDLIRKTLDERFTREEEISSKSSFSNSSLSGSSSITTLKPIKTFLDAFILSLAISVVRGQTMTTKTSNQRHATIAHEWLLKSVEIILSSRRGRSLVEKTKKQKKKKKKTATNNSWWFNLRPNFLENEAETEIEEEEDEIDEDSERYGMHEEEEGEEENEASLIRNKLEPWRFNDNELGFNPTPLILDIFHCCQDEKDPKRDEEEAFLVERWVLSVDPLNAPDASCVSNPSYETSVLYKKAVIQTRVLISLLRSLPAHRLERRARLKLRADAGEMFHKIYASTSIDCKPKNMTGENFVWRTFMFSKIETKVGQMHARCFFLDEHSLNESRKAPGVSLKNKDAAASASVEPLLSPRAASASDVGASRKVEYKKDVQQKTKVKGLLTAELLQAKCEDRSGGNGEIDVVASRKNKPPKNDVAINSSSAPSNLFGREYESPNPIFQSSPYGSPGVRLEPPEQQPLTFVSPRIATFSSNVGGKKIFARQNENEELFALDEDVSATASFEKTNNNNNNNNNNNSNGSNTDMEIGALVRLLKDAPGLCPLGSVDTFEDAQERLETFKSSLDFLK